MPPLDVKRPRRKRLLFVALFAVAGLFFLYTIAGFWILPRVAQSMLPELIAEHLPVKASLGKIHLNPFLLTASVRDVTVKDNDGQHLVGLKELYADLQLFSIFRGAPVLKEVRLTEPDALLQVLPDGRINVLTILPAADQPPDADAEKPVQLPIVEVDRFTLKGGKVVLRDLSSKIPLEAVLFPIQVNLQNFTTRTDTESRFEFRAGTDRDEQIGGEGHLTVQPIAARGALTASGNDLHRLWQAVQEAVNFEITDGRLDLGGSFSAGVGTDGLRMQLTDGRVDLKRFSLAEKGESTPLVSVPSFSVAGVGFDLNERRVRVESVQTDDARIRTSVFPDGSIQLLSVLLPESPPANEASSTPKPETPPAFNIEEWNLQIDSVAVKNAGIELQDRGISPPVPLIFEPIDLSVKNLSNQKNANASIALDVRDDFGGQFKISGQAGVNPVMADLQVRVLKAAIKKLEPYVKAVAAVDVVSGTADVNGRIQFVGSGAAPKLKYRGATRVENVQIHIPADQRDLIKFASLSINGVQVDLEPNSLKIDEIVLDGLDGNLVIEPDGRMEVNRVMESAKKESTEIADSLPARLVLAIKKSIRGPVPMRIDKLQVKQASARFEDRSLKPEFAMAVEKLEAEMTGISTEESALVKVKMGGWIDSTAPLDISGSLLPFGEKTNMEMRVSLKDFELRSVSSYAGKHVGYTVEKGRLSLALEYSLSEDIITGKNDILLKQLTLGNRTDSPDAVKLPLDLAIALLKDLKGNIKINIPVSGDINDPQFSAGNVLADTLIKFVTGVVSSPFKVMEGLAGVFSSEELDSVFFEPGSAALHAHESEKLDAIAKALRERPSLQVKIRGQAYVNLDSEAMAPGESETASTDQPVAGRQQLRELAGQRARSIRDALVVKGNVESNRVKMLPVEVVPKGIGSQVSSTLFLTAK